MLTVPTASIALFAGLVSFLSPCVLPIIPGYLSYLAGTSTQTGDEPSQKQIFLTSAMFVLGFASVFALLGVLMNTLLSSVAYDAQAWLARAGGALIIIFGLHLSGLLRLNFLDRELRVSVKHRFDSRYITGYIFGAAFAAGWTPCVGAVLGAILGLAASAPGTAFSLLMIYALGLGLPFLLIGAFTAKSRKYINQIGPYLLYINRFFGAILIVMGILIFTQNLSRLANFGFLSKLFLN